MKKGDPAVVGITKLDGITMEELKRPRRAIPLGPLSADTKLGAAAAATATTVSASLSPDA